MLKDFPILANFENPYYQQRETIDQRWAEDTTFTTPNGYGVHQEDGGLHQSMPVEMLRFMVSLPSEYQHGYGNLETNER